MFLYIILYRDDSLELNKLGNKLPETVRNYLFKTLFCLQKRSLRVALFLNYFVTILEGFSIWMYVNIFKNIMKKALIISYICKVIYQQIISKL